MSVHPTLKAVTDRIEERSKETRATYLSRMRQAASEGPRRAHLSCSGQAHAYAAMGRDKDALATSRAPNIGIVTSYNDMLSAHKPYEDYPELIREAARKHGVQARVHYVRGGKLARLLDQARTAVTVNSTAGQQVFRLLRAYCSRSSGY